MLENINYAEKVLKKSQALEAGPLLYHSVPHWCNISRDNISTDSFRNRIFHRNLIPDIHSIP